MMMQPGSAQLRTRGPLAEAAFDVPKCQFAEETLSESEGKPRLRSSQHNRDRFGNIIGKSPAIQRVYELILNAAATDANVILYGESGTGKELVAHAIHEMSSRKSGSFVPVNCGAIPETLMESEFFGHRKGAFTGAIIDKHGFLDLADGGTLFLDELGEIGQSMQVKLLRAIDGGGFTPIGGSQVKTPDLRIIAATNRDVAEQVRKGVIREDFSTGSMSSPSSSRRCGSARRTFRSWSSISWRGSAKARSSPSDPADHGSVKSARLAGQRA